jgi:predicted permease
MWFKRRDPRVGDEVRFHRDKLIEDYMAAGIERREAERRAFLEFGNPAQIEEAVRDVRGRRLEELSRDLRYTLRSLRRNPVFAAVAVLSLALGIGANSAIFSLVNAVILRSLPVPQPHRLVQLTRLVNGQPGFVSYPLFEHFRDNVKSVSGIFVQNATDAAITIDGEDEFVAADLVSGDYFTVLGIQPAAGRVLTPQDDVRSASSAAVITDRYWQRRFGRSPAAIGKTFTLRDVAFTIVGVTPAPYDGARPGRLTDVMLPLSVTMPPMQRMASDFNWLNLMARLKPGATVEQANAEIQVLFEPFKQTQAARGAAKERDMFLRARVIALDARDGFNPIRYAIARPLIILMGTVALILLLACINLSGLLLARAAAREREISIRLAMGAGRGRLVRQFLTESLVLAVLGGGVGFALAGWFSARLFALFIGGRDVVLAVTPDWRVLLFTAGVSLVACCLAGLAPALQALKVNVNPTLKQVRVRGDQRLGKALVIAQLSISMILLVAATLFVGTLVKLYSVSRGFDSEGVLVLNVRTGRPYSPDRIAVVERALIDRLATIPGVRSVSAAQMLPATGGLWDRTVQVEGYVFRPDESETVGFNTIAPGYFATLGTPLLSGREFDARDTATSPPVAIVNESFARYFFGEQSSLGKRVTSVNVTYEIVGVVGDATYEHLRVGTIKTMYIPWTQHAGDQPSRYSYLVRLAAGDPLRLVPGLDRVIREADPALRIRRASTYSAIVADSIANERIMATLGGFFGVLALLVAALGMFGVLAFQVARRTNELGVRMALGANRAAMMRLVLRDVVVMVAAGVVIGGAGAFVLTGLARTIVFGLTPTDPRVFAIAAAVLAFAAFLAGWMPARRASSLDPVIALRAE